MKTSTSKIHTLSPGKSIHKSPIKSPIKSGQRLTKNLFSPTKSTCTSPTKPGGTNLQFSHLKTEPLQYIQLEDFKALVQASSGNLACSMNFFNLNDLWNSLVIDTTQNKENTHSEQDIVTKIISFNNIISIVQNKGLKFEILHNVTTQGVTTLLFNVNKSTILKITSGSLDKKIFDFIDDINQNKISGPVGPDYIRIIEKKPTTCNPGKSLKLWRTAYYQNRYTTTQITKNEGEAFQKIEDGPRGSSKQLYKKNAQYVKLKSYHTNVLPLNRELQELLHKKEISTMVMQHQIKNNRDQQAVFVVSNLGEDLEKRTDYKFNLNHFKQLITDLEKLHDERVVHLDIKPENLFFKNDMVLLSDLDGMEYMHKINSVKSTEIWCPLYLSWQANKRGTEIDKYAILSTIIHLYLLSNPPNIGDYKNIISEDNLVSSYKTMAQLIIESLDSNTIRSALSKLIKAVHVENVINVLSKPTEYALTEKLSDILNFESDHSI